MKSEIVVLAIIWIIFAISLAIGIYITVRILNSDLPLWLKYLLLK